MLKRVNRAALVLLLSVAAVCGNGCAAQSGDIKIWSAPATKKIMRDKHDYSFSEAKIAVEMAKGETEGAQIGFTPENDVKSYMLETSELYCGDTAFGRENIAVYVQKYIEVTEKTGNQTNDEYPAGYIPDMLLPIETVQTYNENVVSRGENQSLSVEFTTVSDTKPGVYTGNFTLKIDSRSYSVPVSVTVWDMDVTECYGKSAFGLFSSPGLPGELSNTDETYRVYYETMLNDYKMCAYYLPGWDKSSADMLESLLYYWDNPNFTTYNIPMFAESWKSQKMSEPLFIQYLTDILRASGNGTNLLEKAVVYLSLTDEPSSAKDVEAANALAKSVKSCAERAIEGLEEEGFFAGIDEAFALELKETTRNLPTILTSVYRSAFEGTINAFCPPVQYYNTEGARELYKQQAENVSGEQWFYTCMQPVYPYPSHHIDDYLLGARTMRWMQKSYGVEGYLYYAVNFYYNFITGEQLNPYEDPVRFQTASHVYPGDGYLFYPGKAYGSKKPFGSLRAVSVRDGQEDYNMLSVTANAVSSLASFYGVTEEDTDVFSSIYDTLFTGTVYETDDELLYAARRAVYDIYSDAKSDCHLLVCSPETDGDAQTLKIFAAEGWKITVNGQIVEGVQSGEGVKYLYSTQLNKADNSCTVTAEKDGVKITRYVTGGAETYRATNFAGESEAGLGVSEGGSISIESGRTMFNVVSYGESVIDILSFRPFVSFDKTLFGGDFANIDAITLTLSNLADEEMTFAVSLLAGGAYNEAETVTLKAGETKKVVLRKVYALQDAMDATALSLVFENADENNNLLPDRKIAVGEIYYSPRRSV